MSARLRDIAEGRRDALNIDPKLIKIEKNFNPRSYLLFDNREHLDVLKASIREIGVKVPLLVRWDPATEQAILIDGECRLRACLELIDEGTEIKTVPVLQEQATNEADRLLLAITTNTGKPLSSWEVGRAFRRLLNFGWTVDDIAKRVGRPLPFVKEALELSDAPQDVKEMLSEGKVTPALARQVVRKEGAGAGAKLKEAVETAKAKGKKKATRERGEGKVTKARKAEKSQAATLAEIGDELAEEVLSEHGEVEKMERLARKWRRARKA